MERETSEFSLMDMTKRENMNAKNANTDRKTLTNSIHGNVFQRKLLMLFMFRAISLKYSFKLNTENPSKGGKFDDVIFEYEKKSQKLLRLVQAKHKAKNVNKITAQQLFSKDEKGDFDLLMYFRSFREVITKVNSYESIEDCVICTNAPFDENSLRKCGIEIEELTTNDDFLEFKNLPLKDGIPRRYKFKKESIREHFIKAYPDDDIEEDANRFLDKLVFAVSSPNEKELDLVIKSIIGNHLNLSDNLMQNALFSQKVSNWFTEKEATSLTQDDGEKILEEIKLRMESIRLTGISNEYQNNLESIIAFDHSVIIEMANKLIKLLAIENSTSAHIVSESPKCTAAKVSAAIKELEDFKNEDSYLLLSRELLYENDRENIIKDVLELDESHRLVVVVCEVEALDRSNLRSNFISEKQRNKKKIIFIRKKDDAIEDNQIIFEDESLDYEQLKDETKENLLSKSILFQGTVMSVRDLIFEGSSRNENQQERFLDSNSLVELLLGKRRVEIPSQHFAHATRFEKSNYMNRHIGRWIWPSDQQFWAKVAENLSTENRRYTVGQLESECQWDEQSCRIKWAQTDNKRNKKIWKAIYKTNSEIDSSSYYTIQDEDEFIESELKQGQVTVVISGVAGTGKSFTLLQFYKKIKELKPNQWVVAFNLVNHCEALSQSGNLGAVDSNILINFLFKHFASVVSSNSYFAQSLLRQRLMETGNITFLLDGFDEISNELQMNTIIFIKALTNKTKVDQIFITTRPHMNETLQDAIQQFVCKLELLEEKDQCELITSSWKSKLERNLQSQNYMKAFAESLLKQMSNNLKNEEKEFIGVPLQCHILAECFEHLLEEALKTNAPVEILIKKCDLNFDLAELYRRLLETKCRIYKQDKIKVDDLTYHLVSNAVQTEITYLTELAVLIILETTEDADIFLYRSPYFESKYEQRQKDKINLDFGVRIGLLNKNKNNVEFLHRTYAEYLVANYLFQGFHLDEDKHNHLLDTKLVRNFLVKKIFTEDLYEGVIRFLDCMMASLIESEMWRNAIDQNNVISLPHRFRGIIETALCIKEWIQASDIAYERKCVNIYKFMCDCLEGCSEFWRDKFGLALDQAKQRRRIFVDSAGHSAMNRRFIKLYDRISDDYYRQSLYSYMCYQMEKLNKADLTIPSSWNNEDRKKIVEFLLEILKKQKSQNIFFLSSIIVRFFISNSYYDNVLPLLLSIISEDDHFLGHLRYALRSYKMQKCWIEGRIEIFLGYFIDLLQRSPDKNCNLIQQVHREVLAVDPDLFIRVYQFSKTEIETLENFQFLEKDVNGMTILQKVAFFGNLELMDKIFSTKDNPLMETEILEILFNDDLPPFLIAASQCNEEMCRKILRFMKLSVPIEQLRNSQDRKKFLLSALGDAIDFGKYSMFRVILASIKEEFGPSFLKDMLSLNFLGSGHLAWTSCQDENSFRTMIEVIIHDSGNSSEQCNNPYGLLNELFFQTKDIMLKLELLDKEILSRMISADGFEYWVKRLLNTDVEKGFDLLAFHLFEKFDKVQQKELPKIITNSSGTNTCGSYLSQLFRLGSDCLENTYNKFFECITTNLGEKVLYGMLIFSDCREALVSGFLSLPGRSLVIAIMNHFSKKNIKKMVKIFLKILPQVIQEMYEARKTINLNTMDFIFSAVENFANKLQVLSFIKAILFTPYVRSNVSLSPTKSSVQSSVWSAFIRDRIYLPDYFRSLKEKLGLRSFKVILKELVFHNDGELFSCYPDSSMKYLDDVLSAYLNNSSNREIVIYRKTIGKYLLRNFDMKNQQSLSEKAQIMPNVFRLLLKYSDTSHVNKFFGLILSEVHSDRGQSIWSQFVFLFIDDLNSYREQEKALMFMQLMVQYKVEKEYVENLLFHENGQLITRLLLWGNDKLVGLLLCYLSPKNKEKVAECIMKHTLSVVSEQTNPVFNQKRRGENTNVYFFSFLLEYANKKDFPDFIVSMITDDIARQVIWRGYLCNILFKENELENCIEDFALSKVDQLLISVLSRLPTDQGSKFQKNFVDVLLKFMEETRTWENQSVLHSWIIFQKSFLHYGDSQQLSQLLDLLLFVNNKGYKRSLWSHYIYQICDKHMTYRVKELLNCVSIKVSTEKVKELVLHSPSEGSDKVIIRAALDGDMNLVKAMLAYLNQKDRAEVEFLQQEVKNA